MKESFDTCKYIHTDIYKHILFALVSCIRLLLLQIQSFVYESWLPPPFWLTIPGTFLVELLLYSKNSRVISCYSIFDVCSLMSTVCSIVRLITSLVLLYFFLCSKPQPRWLVPRVGIAPITVEPILNSNIIH